MYIFRFSFLVRTSHYRSGLLSCAKEENFQRFSKLTDE